MRLSDVRGARGILLLVPLILAGSGLLYAVHAPLAYQARLLATVPLRAMPLDLAVDAADNRVFVTDDDGHLVMLNARAGRLVGSAALINGAMPLYAASARRLFVLGASAAGARSHHRERERDRCLAVGRRLPPYGRPAQQTRLLCEKYIMRAPRDSSYDGGARTVIGLGGSRRLPRCMGHTRPRSA